MFKDSKKRSLKNLKSKRKMSQLEKLPVELLQKVYLFALNINLPRASPILGAKLTSDLIYHKTILAAFRPTWDYWGKFAMIYSRADQFLTKLHINNSCSMFQVSNPEQRFFMY
jgi:hypothetical protein